MVRVESYLAHDSLGEDRLRKLLEIFEHYRPQRILDIGCCRGQLTCALRNASRASEVYGVDIDHAFVDYAKQLGINASALDVNQDSLPFQDSSFDGVFCGDVIEHLTDTDHLLEEVLRVLKPNGIAVIATPNLAAWYNRIALLLGFQPFFLDTGYKYCAGRLAQFGKTGGGHVRLFTYRALMQTLSLHGFKILRTMGTYMPMSRHGPVNSLNRFMGRITSPFPNISGSLIVVVTKE